MKILQANVGRGDSAHDLLLSFEADVILVQEPWTDMTRQITKTHPRYQLIGPITRWLGILLDTKLSFRPHINRVFSRGRQLALHLRRLSNTQRGCPAASMRAAVNQCVIPTAL